MIKVIAELGNTHEGSVGLAKCMITAAANSGADVVKLQTHIFEAESLASAPNPPYFSGESRREYFERTSFSHDQYVELIEHAGKQGVELISSPFSVEALEFLIDLGMKTIKIPSGEVTNVLLLNALAKQNVDTILSSGMSSFEELDHAVKILKTGNNKSLSVLQCTSEYPCQPENVGLENIEIFKQRYACKVGFSDHTLSESIPALAVYAGAEIIEKHFTLSQLAYGSDAANSLEPAEFARMVTYIKEAFSVRESKQAKGAASEYISNMKTIFEKSLVYSGALESGHVLEYKDFSAKKPGDGLPPRTYTKLLGRTLKVDVACDQRVAMDDVL